MFSLAFTYEGSLIEQVHQLIFVRCRGRKVVLQNCHNVTRVAPIPRRKPPTRRSKEQMAAGHEDLQDVFANLNFSTGNNRSLPFLRDVMGLESAKEVLQEAAMFPEHFPDRFKLRRAWKSILLYGPPGVGKTYISKAIAAESKSRFFTLTVADLITASAEKDEKVVGNLFSAARRSGKVVFYLHDIDILFSSRLAYDNESLSRVKGQLLKEFQTLQECVNNVVLIASSRAPWLLEEAFLRRMDRRVYIGLPDVKSRTKMLKRLLRRTPHTLSQEDIENIATECETYSGSDMKVLVMDAEMEPLRVVQHATYFRNISMEEEGEMVELMSPCSPNDDGATKMKYTSINRDMFHIPPITCLDFELALDRTKPTVGLDTVEKHLDFTMRSGQDG